MEFVMVAVLKDLEVGSVHMGKFVQSWCGG